LSWLWFALHQAVNREVKSCSAVAAITSGLLKTIVSAAQTPSAGYFPTASMVGFPHVRTLQSYPGELSNLK
jgi:hypothetical protein